MPTRTEFEDIYSEHAKIIFDFLLNRTRGQHHLSEDLAAETWLHAWKHWPDFQCRGSIRSWLFSIASSKHIDYLRSAYQRHETDVLEVVPGLMRGVDRQTPERIICSNESVREIGLAIDGLLPTYRKAIVGRLSGLTDGELAISLGAERKNLKYRMIRARRSLKENLNGRQ